MFHELFLDESGSGQSGSQAERYYEQIKDVLRKSDETFLQGLTRTASIIQQKKGLSPVDDAQDAAIIVSSAIITRSLAKAGKTPAPHALSPDNAVAAATLTCFVSMVIAVHLKEEGEHVSIHRMIREAGGAVFRMCDKKNLSTLIQLGMEKFRELLAVAKEVPKMRKVGDILSKSVRAYVQTRDETFIEGIAEFYTLLIKAYGP